MDTMVSEWGCAGWATCRTVEKTTQAGANERVTEYVFE